MLIILWGLLSLWSAVSHALNDSTFQQQALLNAQHYAKEAQELASTVPLYTTKENQELTSAHLNKVTQVLVFLSFSQSQQSLEGWLRQCQQYSATPVIRGLINNSFQETMRAIKTLSEKTGVGVQLDPILFRTFAITQVPAVVKVHSTGACSNQMSCKPLSFERVYGDVSLEYALEKMQ